MIRLTILSCGPYFLFLNKETFSVSPFYYKYTKNSSSKNIVFIIYQNYKWCGCSNNIIKCYECTLKVFSLTKKPLQNKIWCLVICSDLWKWVIINTFDKKIEVAIGLCSQGFSIFNSNKRFLVNNRYCKN